MSKTPRKVLSAIVASFVVAVSPFALKVVDAGNSDALIVRYTFNEGRGTTAQNKAGDNFNAQLVDGAFWTSGKRNGGLGFVRPVDPFNGVSARAEAAGPISLPSNEVTFSMWYRGNASDGDTNWQALLSDPSCCSYRILLYPGGRPYINAGQHADWYLPGISLGQNRWYHIALTIKGGGSAKLYIDGQLMAEQTHLVPAQLPPLSGLALGSGERNSGYYYSLHGKLDEVRVYNRALSAENVLRDMRGKRIKSAHVDEVDVE